LLFQKCEVVQGLVNAELPGGQYLLLSGCLGCVSGVFNVDPLFFRVPSLDGGLRGWCLVLYCDLILLDLGSGDLNVDGFPDNLALELLLAFHLHSGLGRGRDLLNVRLLLWLGRGLDEVVIDLLQDLLQLLLLDQALF
jgi:hypothetical protein